MDILAISVVIILVLTVLLVLAAAVWPKLKGYRLVLQKRAPRKKRPARAKSKSKKKKSVWIKVL